MRDADQVLALMPAAMPPRRVAPRVRRLIAGSSTKLHTVTGRAADHRTGDARSWQRQDLPWSAAEASVELRSTRRGNSGAGREIARLERGTPRTLSRGVADARSQSTKVVCGVNAPVRSPLAETARTRPYGRQCRFRTVLAARRLPITRESNQCDRAAPSSTRSGVAWYVRIALSWRRS